MLAMRSSSFRTSVLGCGNRSTARPALSSAIAPRLLPASGCCPATRGAQLTARCSNASASKPAPQGARKARPSRKVKDSGYECESTYTGAGRPAGGDDWRNWQGQGVYVSCKGQDKRVCIYPPGSKEVASEWHDVVVYCMLGPSKANLIYPDRDWASDPRVQKYSALPKGHRLRAMRADNGIKQTREGVYVTYKDGGWDVYWHSATCDFAWFMRATSEREVHWAADVARLWLRGLDGAAAAAAAKGFALRFPERVCEYVAVLASYWHTDTTTKEFLGVVPSLYEIRHL